MLLDLELDLPIDLARLQVKAPRAGRGQSQAQEHLDDVIARVLAKPRAQRCGCGLHEGISRAQIRGLGAGCTAATPHRLGWVCPTLDAVRRGAGL